MKKQFFLRHAKSSAVLVSLGIHAILILVALSFVAVTVIQKEGKSFEAKPINRPKMHLRKLQVPVNIKKKKVQKPKLRKRIVVQPKVSKNMPEIKMPEISGIKGGLGTGAGVGLGDGAGIGFTMPEIEIFGVRSRGEKVFIILDSSPEIMADEMGGIRAYAIIKEQLVRILDGLSPTVLFNIIVYDQSRCFMLFPNMSPAISANVEKVGQWLKPLNAVRPGMGSKEYGVGTLGPGGQQITEDMRVDVFKSQNEWYRPAMLAMKQQADAVFLLTCWWGNQWHYEEPRDKSWDQSSAGRRYYECYNKAKQLLAEENKERAARGAPPRVLPDSPWAMNNAYFPDIEFPPVRPTYSYTASDFTEAMLDIRNEYRPKEPQTKSGLRKKPSKNKVDFSFNVVHFREASDSRHANRHSITETKFRELTIKLHGEYETIKGLEAIQGYVSRPRD